MISGEIFEKDISEEDMDALIELYNLEAEQIKKDTKVRKDNISKLLKNLRKK